ncbi:LPD7 domain-containing protein [Phenylobacterium sp.]|uniref:LPD7 domain-containing protein n=1 Tax=Phenylobacterium sp. TaxID=1871053 RepID=UPI00395AC491
MAEDLNILAPEGERRSNAPGDVPEQVRRRYLTESRDGPGLGFYADARAQTAAFRDQDRRLTTDRNDPHVVRDLVAIAQHRGWNTISVRGHSEFRREVWLRARAAGLEVRGYRPTERDLQHAERAQASGSVKRTPELDAQARLRIVESVVRARVVESAEQARILSAARSRLARWLDPGVAVDRKTPPERSRARG